MEESNFASLDRELTDDISGTEAEPLLVRVMTGKLSLGTVFVIKIGDPKVGKNFQKACSDWTELGYPSYFPFVHCVYGNV